MGHVASEFDEMYQYPDQDPHDPVWTTDADIAEMPTVDDPADQYGDGTRVPAVRTASNELDFLDGLKEVAHNFLGTDQPIKPPKAKLDAIRTRELGSDNWRGGTRAVTSAMQYPILTNSSKRRRVTFTNFGPNTVYLSSISSVAGGSNTTRLDPVNPATGYFPTKMLETRGDVWAVCAAGQTASIDIDEEFDLES